MPPLPAPEHPDGSKQDKNANRPDDDHADESPVSALFENKSGRCRAIPLDDLFLDGQGDITIFCHCDVYIGVECDLGKQLAVVISNSGTVPVNGDRCIRYDFLVSVLDINREGCTFIGQVKGVILALARYGYSLILGYIPGLPGFQQVVPGSQIREIRAPVIVGGP